MFLLSTILLNAQSIILSEIKNVPSDFEGMGCSFSILNSSNKKGYTIYIDNEVSVLMNINGRFEYFSLDPTHNLYDKAYKFFNQNYIVEINVISGKEKSDYEYSKRKGTIKITKRDKTISKTFRISGGCGV